METIKIRATMNTRWLLHCHIRDLLHTLQVHAQSSISMAVTVQCDIPGLQCVMTISFSLPHASQTSF